MQPGDSVEVHGDVGVGGVVGEREEDAGPGSSELAREEVPRPVLATVGLDVDARDHVGEPAIVEAGDDPVVELTGGLGGIDSQGVDRVLIHARPSGLEELVGVVADGRLPGDLDVVRHGHDQQEAGLRVFAVSCGAARGGTAAPLIPEGRGDLIGRELCNVATCAPDVPGQPREPLIHGLGDPLPHGRKSRRAGFAGAPAIMPR